MSIRIEALSKKFEGHAAVQSASLEINAWSKTESENKNQRNDNQDGRERKKYFFVFYDKHKLF